MELNHRHAECKPVRRSPTELPGNSNSRTVLAGNPQKRCDLEAHGKFIGIPGADGDRLGPQRPGGSCVDQEIRRPERRAFEEFGPGAPGHFDPHIGRGIDFTVAVHCRPDRADHRSKLFLAPL
jgi:hypothetical protein